MWSWGRGEVVRSDEYRALLERVQSLPPADGMYLESDFIQNLLLTVLDFQMHGTSVEKAMAHYQTHRWTELRTLDDLEALLAKHPDDKESINEALGGWYQICENPDRRGKRRCFSRKRRRCGLR